jgi:perosamine synthetase
MDARYRRWPEILDEDREAVLRVLDSGVLSGAQAPEISALEREFADYLGVEYCISTNSGTAALHCCCAAVGLQTGDEVIVPALTFIASAMAVLHQGAVPVFCDIDPQTFNIDPALIEERITERTKAIVVVHLHGLPADMDEILAIARRYGLAVIEDGAQAPGATYKQHKVGTMGNCAAFSLQATKNLCGGDGGLFVTNDEQGWLAARRLTMFGEDVPPPEHFGRVYWSHSVGYNYRNHELSAALARSQLRRLDHYNTTASTNAQLLTNHLAAAKGITPPHTPPNRTHTYYFYRVRFDPVALGYDPSEGVALRDWIISALKAHGVPAMVWQHWPLPAHRAFRTAAALSALPNKAAPMAEWQASDYPTATGVCDSTFILGSSEAPLMVQDESLMHDYAECVAEIVDRAGASSQSIQLTESVPLDVMTGTAISSVSNR